MTLAEAMAAVDARARAAARENFMIGKKKRQCQEGRGGYERGGRERGVGQGRKEE